MLFAAWCDELNETKIVFPRTDLVMRFELN